MVRYSLFVLPSWSYLPKALRLKIRNNDKVEFSELIDLIQCSHCPINSYMVSSIYTMNLIEYAHALREHMLAEMRGKMHRYLLQVNTINTRITKFTICDFNINTGYIKFYDRKMKLKSILKVVMVKT